MAPRAPFPADGPIDRQRINLVLIVFGAIMLLFAARIAYLTLIAGPANAEKALETRTVSFELTAKRGTIYDREGRVLAMSVDAKTIYCNPSEVEDARDDAQRIAQVLGGKSEDYLDALTADKTSFAYLARRVDVDAAEKVDALGLAGVYLIDDTKRVYPNNEVAGQLVGMVDVDGNGLSGLELYYDDILRGEDGKLSAERGMNGYPIAGGNYDVTPAKNGRDIVVSIDVEMQEYLQQRLSEQVEALSGKRGNALLYDAGTGEILAAAGTPYLNPNDRTHIEEGATELGAVSGAYEPGSIFKVVTMAAILEAGTYAPSSEIFCPAALAADEYWVTDEAERGDETMSLTQILARSSNVGTSLAASKLGFGPLYSAIVRYRLNELTGVDFPGEASGYLSDWQDWSTIQAYNVSFGQGVTVTPLQMARFYGALLDEGYERTPHFLLSIPGERDEIDYERTKVIDNTAMIDELIPMMKEVVASGTGKTAQIEGFEPAGKTGTAEIASPDGGYLAGENNISFVGFLPDSTSKLVCFVGVTEVPGDNITTPAFKDIMTFAINHYRITPK